MVTYSGLVGSMIYTYMRNSSQITSAWAEEKRLKQPYDSCFPKGPLKHIQNPSYIELVRIALCYYVAKLDGVSQDEQEIIDGMCLDLLDNPNGGDEFRTELRMILADKGTKFDNVKRYLNRVDTETLEEFKNDIIRIAETTDGITENEKQAIETYQQFIEERKKLDETVAK